VKAVSDTEVETHRRFLDVDDDSLDGRIGRLFRNVGKPEPLAAAELDRVSARLHERRIPTLSPPRYAALLATGMLAGTGFAFAAYGVQRLVETPKATSVPVPAPPPVVRAPDARPGSLARPPSVVEKEPAPESARPRVAAPAPEPSSGALGRETELLSRALAKLRRDRDPGAALVLLDEHARDFPAGVLRLEADVARLDALLALGRNAEALAMLERLPVDRLGRGAELRVIRAELRAERDPRKSIADFDRALAAGLSSELEERARFGRAANRLRTGDETGGRAELETYLAKYPQGRFAAEARRRLAAH
jgi:hypothetical protein